MNQELPDVQTGFQGGRGTRDQIANIHEIMEKAKEFQNNIYFCFIDYTKNFVWITTNWKILKEMEIPTYLTCLLICMQIKKQQLELDMEQPTGSKLGKEYIKAVLPVLLFNLYAEYNMWNARLDDSQAGIKIAGRNIKNLRYADDTTLIGESEEELKGLLMSVQEGSEKTGLKLNIQKSEIMASGPITLWQIEGEKVEVVTDLIFVGSKIPMDGDWSHEIERCLLLGREDMTNLQVG